MENLKIGVVEDDLIIAKSLVSMLNHIGYRTTKPARNFDEALKMISVESPDMLLIDIVLDGNFDGIDLASKLREDDTIPFIFITANSDKPTVERAKKVRPFAYLLKPFNENDLFTAIEIGFSAFNHETKQKNKPQEKIASTSEFIFIKENHLFHKVAIKDMIFIECDNVYLNIITEKRTFLVRSKLDDFINDFTNGSFFRTHRSYAINIMHLEAINGASAKIAQKEIPLQKPYRQELLKIFKHI